MQKKQFYLHKDFFMYILCDKDFLSKEMKALLDNPEDYICRSEAETIQNNFKNKIIYLEIRKVPIVVKIHNYKSTWDKLK